MQKSRHDKTPVMPGGTAPPKRSSSRAQACRPQREVVALFRNRPCRYAPDMTESPHPLHPVIVGVAPGQSMHVVEAAANFAAHFGAELVCVYVRQDRVPLADGPDGTETSVSLDPDSSDGAEDPFDANLASALELCLRDAEIPWRTVVLAGEVSAALGRLATRLDAAMIVIGTHNRSVGGSIQELFNRSVATHLAHRQTKPVVVIPSATTRAGSFLQEHPE